MLDRAVLNYGFHLLHPLDAELDGAKIGERSAEPSTIDVMSAAALGFLHDGCLNLFLGSDKNDLAAVGHGIPHKIVGFPEQVDRLL